MAELGEISVKLTAKTQDFERGMRGAADKVAGASKAVAGLTLAAGAAAAALVGGLASAAAAVVKEVAAMGDAAAKAAGRMGTTAEAVQELKHAAELSGSSIETVEKAFVKLGKNAHEALQDGVGPAKEAFDLLGMSLTDASGKLKTNEQLFMEAADALAGMENQTQRVALAQEVFGKSGTKLLPMLNAGAEGIAAMRQEARELGIVMSNDAAATSERFNDQMDRLNKVFTGLKMTIGTALLPAFTKLVDVALAVTKELVGSADAAKFMDDAIGFVTKQVLNLIDGMITFSPVIAGIITAIRAVVNAHQIWTNIITIIVKAVGVLATSLYQFVSGSLSGFIGAAGEVAAALGQDGIASALATASKGVAAFADTMGELRGGLLSSIDDDITDIAGDIGDLDDAFSGAISGETEKGIRDSMGRIKAAVSEVGTAALDTSKKFESGMHKVAGDAEATAERVKSAMDAAKLSVMGALGAAGKSIEWEQQAEAARIEQQRRDNFPEGDFGTTVPAGPQGVPAGTSGMGGLPSGAEMAAFSATLAGMSGGTSIVIEKFAALAQGSEGFQRAQQRITGVFDSIFGPVIEKVMGNLFRVIEPIADIFDALAPILSAVMMTFDAISPLLKGLAAVLRLVVEPIEKFMAVVMRAVLHVRVAIANIGRKKKNKAEVAEDGTIIDPLAGTRKGIDGAVTPEEYRRMNAETVTRRGVNDPGYTAVTDATNAYLDSIYMVTDAKAAEAKATREATQAITNVPVIFRANLRRSQSSGAQERVGRDFVGGSTGLDNLAAGRPGSVYVAGNVIMMGSTLEEMSRNFQRRNYVRNGQTFAGPAANFDLVTAG